MHGLIDFGANDSLIDSTLVEQAHVPIVALKFSTIVNALDSLFIISSPTSPVLLGHPWLGLHNPYINWASAARQVGARTAILAVSSLLHLPSQPL